MRRITTLSLVLMLLGLAACADQPQTVQEPADDELVAPEYEDSVLATAQDAGLTTFTTAVTEANLDDRLTQVGPYTVFAPSDEAFDALEAGALRRFRDPQNQDALRSLVTYHVITQRMMSGELAGEQTIETVNGESITITATDEGVTLTDSQGNTAIVITADLDAANGVVHVIDSVMLPAAISDLLDDHDDEDVTEEPATEEDDSL